MACNKTTRIHRYHDGELSADERMATEAHLRACDECRQTLADLRRLSLLITQAPLTEPPDDAMDRLHAYRPAAGDRGILRITSGLTAAAAAILIAALLFEPADTSDANNQPAIWETIAVMAPTVVQDDGNVELLTAAQWMADDLSTGERW
ncbi:MAG: hypothetical protein GXY44_01765 [Phycisphaerales bacterium]|nr:hypothetical protein [Phycisphaerales bacterium]